MLYHVSELASRLLEEDRANPMAARSQVMLMWPVVVFEKKFYPAEYRVEIELPGKSVFAPAVPVSLVEDWLRGRGYRMEQGRMVKSFTNGYEFALEIKAMWDSALEFVVAC